jgi:translation initiation factor IF-3
MCFLENNNNSSVEKQEKPAAPAPVTIGGMTLKKRAPGSAPAPSSSPSGGGSPYTRGPRPAGGGGAPFGRPSGPSPNVQKRMERFSRSMPSRDPGVRMNENIRVPEISLVVENGQLGVMSTKEALVIALERNLDLIEIVPNAQPPVCKIIDFGKWKYEQQKRDKQAKKSQHQQLLKEVRFHPNTDTHDFEFKVRHARAFIEEGHKVKAYVQFKGREVAYKQFGEELLNNFKSRIEDIAKIDQDISMMGRTMSMVLSPSGKKKPTVVKAPGEDGEAKPKRGADDGEAPRKKPAREVDATADDTETPEPTPPPAEASGESEAAE